MKFISVLIILLLVNLSNSIYAQQNNVGFIVKSEKACVDKHESI